MMAPKEGIIVGVLGQWSSGKSTAAKTLVSHLGGEDEVVFINDAVLFASQAVNHLRQMDSQVAVSVEDDGRRRLEGECARIWLGPGDDRETVCLGTLRFDVRDDVLPEWLRRARLELGP